MRISVSGRGGGRIGAGRPKKRRPEDAPPVPAGSSSGSAAVPAASTTDGPDVSRRTGTGRDRVGRQVQKVYDELGPLARAQATLIPATELEFRALCALVVIQRRAARALLTAKRVDDAWRRQERTHDSLTRRLETKLRSFRLAPVGEPMTTPQAKPQTTLEALKARRQGLRAV